jgi:hypothetical protein
VYKWNPRSRIGSLGGPVAVLALSHVIPLARIRQFSWGIGATTKVRGIGATFLKTWGIGTNSRILNDIVMGRHRHRHRRRRLHHHRCRHCAERLAHSLSPKSPLLHLSSTSLVADGREEMGGSEELGLFSYYQSGLQCQDSSAVHGEGTVRIQDQQRQGRPQHPGTTN